MAGTELLRLLGPDQVLACDNVSDMLSAVTVDQHDTLGRKSACGVYHVLYKRPVAQSVQHLGQTGFHAGALTGRQNNDS